MTDVFQVSLRQVESIIYEVIWPFRLGNYMDDAAAERGTGSREFDSRSEKNYVTTLSTSLCP